MKMLIALMMMALPMSILGLDPAATDNFDSDANVEVTVTFEDGSSDVFTFQVGQEDTERLEALADVVACTYQFSNGDCSTTASSCAEAREGFLDCADS